jgi:hypothetical protein
VNLRVILDPLGHIPPEFARWKLVVSVEFVWFSTPYLGSCTIDNKKSIETVSLLSIKNVCFTDESIQYTYTMSFYIMI